jgi:hypothetical protein
MSKRKKIYDVFTCASLREKDYEVPKVESNQLRKMAKSESHWVPSHQGYSFLDL